MSVLTDQEFLEACGLYAARLIRQAHLRRGGMSHGMFLQKAFVLMHLRQCCRTQAEAIRELKRLGRGKGRVAAAADALLPVLANMRELELEVAADPTPTAAD